MTNYSDKSDCCNSTVKAVTTEEDTHYECQDCGEPCNLQPLNREESNAQI